MKRVLQEISEHGGPLVAARIMNLLNFIRGTFQMLGCGPAQLLRCMHPSPDTESRKRALSLHAIPRAPYAEVTMNMNGKHAHVTAKRRERHHTNDFQHETAVNRHRRLRAGDDIIWPNSTHVMDPKPDPQHHSMYS